MIINRIQRMKPKGDRTKYIHTAGNGKKKGKIDEMTQKQTTKNCKWGNLIMNWMRKRRKIKF